MGSSYCRDCNSSNISSRKEERTSGNIRETTTFYYCRDCGRVVDRDTTTEYINYPVEPKKDKSW